MKSNFQFLKDDFPVLAKFGELAEQYCYNDSNSCLMKLGMIGETIVNLIFTYDRIPLPKDNTAVNRIDTLFREGMITRDLVDILHALRKKRNLAAHENYASIEDDKALLQAGKIYITIKQMAINYPQWVAFAKYSYNGKIKSPQYLNCIELPYQRERKKGVFGYEYIIQE